MRTSTFSVCSCTRSDSRRTSMVSLRSAPSATSGCWRRVAMKSGAVMVPTTASVWAMTLAERGWPSMAESSPKLWPAFSSRNSTSRPDSENRVTFSRPLTMKHSSCESSW